MESSFERYKNRKNMLHQISNSNSANEDINHEEVYEIMLEKVDKNLLQKTTEKIDNNYSYSHDFSVSKEEAKEFLDQFKKDFNQERFDKLIIDCRKEVINSIVTPFGLGKIIAAYDKAGGNVTTVHNANNKDFIDSGNCVFIGGKTFVVTYQENDFYSNDSHNLVLYPKENTYRDKINQFYLATCVNKSLKHKYSWGDSISSTKIKKDKISLPVKDGEPNYEIMKDFISATQKLVIKDVVHFADSKIEATKLVSNKMN